MPYTIKTTDFTYSIFSGLLEQFANSKVAVDGTEGDVITPDRLRMAWINYIDALEIIAKPESNTIEIALRRPN